MKGIEGFRYIAMSKMWKNVNSLSDDILSFHEQLKKLNVHNNIRDVQKEMILHSLLMLFLKGYRVSSALLVIKDLLEKGLKDLLVSFI